jgi:hypothetical protein
VPAPPAPVGNDRAVSHGAYAQLSAARVDGKVRQVMAALSEDAPVRDHGELPAADGVAIRLLADVLLRIDDIGEYIARRGWADAKGNPRSVLHLEMRLRDQAAGMLDRMGMNPRSRLALGVDLVRARDAMFDLAAEGRRVREARGEVGS